VCGIGSAKLKLYYDEFWPLCTAARRNNAALYWHSSNVWTTLSTQRAKKLKPNFYCATTCVARSMPSCVFVCPSRSCIVSKRVKVDPHCKYIQMYKSVYVWLSFFAQRLYFFVFIFFIFLSTILCWISASARHNPAIRGCSWNSVQHRRPLFQWMSYILLIMDSPGG